MARSPDWFQRLPEILRRAGNSSVYGERGLQTLFGVSRREAFRLLKKFGAGKRDGILTLRREDLAAQIEALQTGGAYQSYLRRNAEIREQLRVARETAPARRMRLPVPPEPALSAELPDGVRILPLAPGQTGRLEIDYATREDLWWKIAGIARARARDRHAIDRLLEPGEGN